MDPIDTIKLLEQAIEAERQAQDRYREGVERAADPETRALFQQLLQWEKEHERLLNDRLATFRLLEGR
ncbi:MAG TPA: ferritin family protein [Candidatus Methylomirabilis sp.]|nr:ferritin family protein [Candidatus Methylomirabilis sp.]